MSNYSKVQFISWELHTGPFVVDRSPVKAGWYPGLVDPSPDKRTDALGQCWDIEARLAFVADAIARAEAKSDRSAGTLKIFMAPEFLFRGAGGAYLQDLIQGWNAQAPAEFNLPAPYSGRWPGLFSALSGLVAKPAFEDWVFVFGTALGASFPARKAAKGKFVLDPTQPGEITNTALIQRGGAAHGDTKYASRKHYISGIDFIRWNGALKQHKPNTVRPLDPESVIPADAMGDTEGGAVFRLAGVNDGSGKPIDFGIEICLDHARSGGNRAAHFGRIRTANQFVRLQLVPSGGMSLEPDSIRLQPGTGSTPQSYAFNCDGLGGLKDGAGSHTQIWNGTGDANKLLEASNGEVAAKSEVVAVATSTMTAHGEVAASMLWDNGNGVKGAGSVRVMAPLPL